MMFRQIKKYYSIDKTERKILNRTFLWLIYAFVLVRLIPLKWFNSVLGKFRKETEVNLNNKQLQLIHMVKKNIKRAKKRLPWEVKCFEEAITAKKLLETLNIKSTLFLGITRGNEKDLKAHAWLKSGDLFISGESGYFNFVVVGFYS